MATFICPFTDIGFKRIFGQDNHKRLLIHFLNALFPRDNKIQSLTYRDKEQLGEADGERCIIYDVYCILDDGRRVIVEMQNKKNVNFGLRALYYEARDIATQGKRGKWQYHYSPVLGVYLLRHQREELGDCFRSDFAISRVRPDHRRTRWEHPWKRHLSRKTPFGRTLWMTFLQLPVFEKNKDQCKTDLDKWIFIMNHMENLDYIPWADEDDVFEELAEVSRIAAMPPQERLRYEEHLRILHDNDAAHAASYLDGEKSGFEKGEKSGFEKGEKSGFEKGEKSKEYAIVTQMLAKGLSTALIAECTGLSEAQIRELQ